MKHHCIALKSCFALDFCLSINIFWALAPEVLHSQDYSSLRQFSKQFSHFALQYYSSEIQLLVYDSSVYSTMYIKFNILY